MAQKKMLRATGLRNGRQVLNLPVPLREKVGAAVLDHVLAAMRAAGRVVAGEARLSASRGENGLQLILLKIAIQFRYIGPSACSPASRRRGPPIRSLESFLLP